MQIFGSVRTRVHTSRIVQISVREGRVNARNKGKPRLMGKKDKRWKGIDRFRYHRRKVPRLTAHDVITRSADPNVTLSETPEGRPIEKIPRIQMTSTEYIQNVKSLTYLAQQRLGCYNLTVSRVTVQHKDALERLCHHAEEIRQSSENARNNLQLYQIIVVDNILRYSRDFQSRHTLWIPDDFLLPDLQAFLEKQCISDPSLHAIKDLRQFYNPFLHPMIGDCEGRIVNNDKQRWQRQKPVELLKQRERKPDETLHQSKVLYP